MTGGGRVSAVGRAHFHGVDPAAVWVIAGDLHRLPEWGPVGSVEWAGNLPSIGDFMAITVRTGPVRRRLRVKVADWQPGRRWSLELDGLAMTTGATLEFRMDSIMEAGEPSAEVELRYRSDMAPWLASMGSAVAGRKLDAAVARLGRMLR